MNAERIFGFVGWEKINVEIHTYIHTLSFFCSNFKNQIHVILLVQLNPPNYHFSQQYATFCKIFE